QHQGQFIDARQQSLDRELPFFIDLHFGTEKVAPISLFFLNDPYSHQPAFRQFASDDLRLTANHARRFSVDDSNVLDLFALADGDSSAHVNSAAFDSQQLERGLGRGEGADQNCTRAKAFDDEAAVTPDSGIWRAIFGDQ